MRVVVLYAPSGGGHRGRTDGDPLRRGRGLTADVGRQILDELIAIDARIIYIGMHPDDQKILYERIKQTEKCARAGRRLFPGGSRRVSSLIARQDK